MANLQLLKKKLDNYSKKGTDFWSPKEGESLIRIVPNKDNEDDPFIEALIYYKTFGKTLYSPKMNGKTDPVEEFVKKLYSTQKLEDREIAKLIQGKQTRW